MPAVGPRTSFAPRTRGAGTSTSGTTTFCGAFSRTVGIYKRRITTVLIVGFEMRRLVVYMTSLMRFGGRCIGTRFQTCRPSARDAATANLSMTS
eukprot:2157635-Pyramimonas_sp.AAC.1